uniref:Uncharacterized protein n=1 Tax=Oryza punctata TaxID=4537 RepID=A0A0E0MKG6_ORYPU
MPVKPPLTKREEGVRTGLENEEEVEVWDGVGWRWTAARPSGSGTAALGDGEGGRSHRAREGAREDDGKLLDSGGGTRARGRRLTAAASSQRAAFGPGETYVPVYPTRRRRRQRWIGRPVAEVNRAASGGAQATGDRGGPGGWWRSRSLPKRPVAEADRVASGGGGARPSGGRLRWRCPGGRRQRRSSPGRLMVEAKAELVSCEGWLIEDHPFLARLPSTVPFAGLPRHPFPFLPAAPPNSIELALAQRWRSSQPWPSPPRPPPASHCRKGEGVEREGEGKGEERRWRPFSLPTASGVAPSLPATPPQCTSSHCPPSPLHPSVRERRDKEGDQATTNRQAFTGGSPAKR